MSFAVADIFLKALVRDNPHMDWVYKTFQKSPELLALRKEIATNKALVIRHLRITVLPPEIGLLKELQMLVLNTTKLSALPPEIGQLKRLQTLVVDHTPLCSLPSEIGDLSQLQELRLKWTQLTSIAPEVCTLINIRILDLSLTHVSGLPGAIGNLVQLQSLMLSGTSIRELPAEIGKLTNLQKLDLGASGISHSPPLTSLPPELGRLTQLQEFHIPRKLHNIPQELLQLHNPMHPQPLLAYLRALDTSSDDQPLPMNQAKVVLVGHGTVGKTSLVEQIVYGRWKAETKRTERIAITAWHLEMPQTQLNLHMWDFGGQEIMHATHELFITNRSLYLVVVDARSGSIHQRLRYWLTLVCNLAPEAPVLVVINKVDEQRDDVDQAYWKQHYPAIKGWFQTSCSSGEGINELRRAISQHISRLPHLQDLLPSTWWHVKQRIEEHKEPYITYDQFRVLCDQCEVTDIMSQATLLKLLHDIGSCLYFPDYGPLAETVVLDPSWVINAIYAIVNDEQFYQKHGVLEFADLKRVLYDYPDYKYAFLVAMMQRFELCVQLDQQRWLLPDLLPKARPKLGDWSNALQIVYEYPIFPRGIITRLIVRVFAPDDHIHFWNTGIMLSWGEHHILVQADPESHRVYISVAGALRQRREVLYTIRHFLTSIHRSYIHMRDEIKVYISAPGYPQHLIDYEMLLSLERKGRTIYEIPELDKQFSIAHLLSGYEAPEERVEISMYQRDPNHARNLIEAYMERLNILELQEARFGRLHVPPHITIEINSLKQTIAKLYDEL